MAFSNSAILATSALLTLSSISSASAVPQLPAKTRGPAAERAAADKGEVVGRWIEPGLGNFGLITIRRKGARFVMLARRLGQPEKEVSELTEHHSKLGREFDVGNRTHDRYLIRADGSLDAIDDAGLIDKSSPVPARLIDPKQIDKAIAAASKTDEKKIDELVAAITAQPITSQETLSTFAEHFVQPKLRDPASAQFSGLHGMIIGSNNYICGSVNAKNGFGGYSGGQRFVLVFKMSMVGEVLFEQQSPKTIFGQAWVHCKQS